jgi:hypothetical protein
MVIPSRCQIDASPVARPGGGCFPSRVSVSISPVKSSGICEVFSKQSRDLYPQQVKDCCIPTECIGGSYPQQIPERIGCKGGFLSKGCLFPAAVLFPSRVELEQWRVPQQSVSCFPEESLEGDIFYAFIM